VACMTTSCGSVTVMRSSRSRVGGLVLLPHFIEHLLPELHHR
jgi:hypothetical protein